MSSFLITPNDIWNDISCVSALVGLHSCPLREIFMVLNLKWDYEHLLGDECRVKVMLGGEIYLPCLSSSSYKHGVWHHSSHTEGSKQHKDGMPARGHVTSEYSFVGSRNFSPKPSNGFLRSLFIGNLAILMLRIILESDDIYVINVII